MHALNRKPHLLRKHTKETLDEHGIMLTRVRGQHLLTDSRVLQKIVASAELRSGDRVLEIGPGTGILTEQLLAIPTNVTAIELDSRLADVLERRFGQAAHFQLIRDDALAFVRNPDRLATIARPYAVVANIPYAITSPLLWALVSPEQQHSPEQLVLLVQKEVAERVSARAGDMNLLAVLVQSYGSVEIVTRVGRGSFLPPPRVDSAVIRIRSHASHPHHGLALRLARAGFTSPRRKVAPQLVGPGLFADLPSVIHALERRKKGSAVRPAELSCVDWQALAEFCTAG